MIHFNTRLFRTNATLDLFDDRKPKMPNFEIEQYELHSVTYRLEAKNEAEAIKRLLDGEATQIDDSQEYIEIAEDVGLSIEDDSDLKSELKALDVVVCEGFVPSIRSIKVVD